MLFLSVSPSAYPTTIRMKVQLRNDHLLFFTVLLLIASCNALPRHENEKQRVCVIGAGAAGLASIKQLADHADEFDIVAFEQKSDVGGLWIYNENVDEDEHGLPVQSSMYKNLRTNIPKELMGFPDYRNFEREERSCVTHETVLEYMRNYTERFNLRQYIQFDTIVQEVLPIGDNNDLQTTQWRVKIKNLNNDKEVETICDAVMVCNGRNSKPKIPVIPGIETFPGRVMHSHFYRKPEDFANKTVALLGAGVSGTDISTDLNDHVEKVYLSHNKKKINQLAPKTIQVAGVVSANGSELTLKDGSKIIADDFIFSTGYNFDYPFIDESSGIIIYSKQVYPLYKDFINAEHPTMSFLGYPFSPIGFSLFYSQALYFVSVLRGKIQLPSKEEMMKEIKLYDDEDRNTHSDEDTWDYYNELIQQAGSEPLPAFYRKAYHIWTDYRAADVLHYKEGNIRISVDGDVTFIPPNSANEF